MSAPERPTHVWAPQAAGERRTSAAVDVSALGAGAPRVVVSVPLGDALPQVSATRTGPGRLQLELTAAAARLEVLVPTRDAVVLWRPSSGGAVAQIPPSWVDAEEVSPLSGTALGALVGREDAVLVGYGADAGDRRLSVRAGLVEETAEFLISIELPPSQLPCSTPDESDDSTRNARPASDRLVVHVDLSGEDVTTVVPRTAAALAGDLAARRPPAGAERPVLCSWYALHLDLTQERLEDLALRGAELGFGTLIVDDGWQTGETARGYGSGGDWRPDPRKVPDPAGFVARLAAADVDVLWWVGTPWIGHRSDAAADHPTLLADDPALEAGVLDPRSPAARSRLVDRLVELLAGTGAHGFKLDFLERFATAGGPPPPDADEVDAEVAALRLLDQLTERARRVRPDVLVEHRQPCTGPAARRTASMLRVADCPMSPARNRVGIVDLRLSAPGSAVHSDPVMWAHADSPERVAQHLLGALFGVPQVSVDLAALPAEHVAVLRHWIGFWNTHAAVLLHGRFRPRRVEHAFPVITADDGQVAITVRYTQALVPAPDGPWRTWYLANADEGPVAVAALPEDVVVAEVRDASGVLVANRLRSPLVEVPVGGVATLRRTGSPQPRGRPVGPATWSDHLARPPRRQPSVRSSSPTDAGRTPGA